MTRSPSFQQIFDQAVEHTSSIWCTLKRLRDFYFKVAAFSRANGVDEVAQPILDPLHDDGFVDDQVTFDMYSFKTDLIQEGAFSHKAFPSGFVLSILSWIKTWSASGSRAYKLSYLELTFAPFRCGNIPWPLQSPSSRSMEMNTLSDRYERPTIAYCFMCVREVLISCFKCFGCTGICYPKQAKVSLGIILPFDGFYAALTLEFVQSLQEAVSGVFHNRNYRKCCDVARPMW